VRKDLGYSLSRVVELLIYLLSMEVRGRPVGYSEIQDELKTDFKTVQRYVNALEEIGWIKVDPTERKNLIRLTDRGRCIARCLVE